LSNEVTVARHYEGMEKKVKELAKILHDALDLTKQLASGMVVSSNWVVARDSLIVEARIAPASVEDDASSITTKDGHELTTAGM